MSREDPKNNAQRPADVSSRRKFLAGAAVATGAAIAAIPMMARGQAPKSAAAPAPADAPPPAPEPAPTGG